jgi:hypothetical protein
MTTQQAEFCKLIASILRRRERQTAHPHPAAERRLAAPVAMSPRQPQPEPEMIAPA